MIWRRNAGDRKGQAPLSKGAVSEADWGIPALILKMNPSTAYGGPPPFNKGGSRAVEGASPYDALFKNNGCRGRRPDVPHSQKS